MPAQVCGKSPKAHLQENTDERPHQCEECGKRFKQSCTLQQHLRTHTGERPYQCEECGKRYPRKSTLQQHLRLHTGERPYQCEECGKKFYHISNLRQHFRVHTGEKPYQCEECGKKFARVSTIRHHLRSHRGEKSHKCKECDKKFISSTDLKNHIRVHTGERPYQCKECGRKFARSFTLQRHLRTHTGERPYQCEECGKKFSRVNNLQKHLTTHKGKKPVDATDMQVGTLWMADLLVTTSSIELETDAQLSTEPSDSSGSDVSEEETETATPPTCTAPCQAEESDVMMPTSSLDGAGGMGHEVTSPANVIENTLEQPEQISASVDFSEEQEKVADVVSIPEVPEPVDTTDMQVVQDTLWMPDSPVAASSIELENDAVPPMNSAHNNTSVETDTPAVTLTTETSTVDMDYCLPHYQEHRNGIVKYMCVHMPQYERAQ